MLEKKVCTVCSSVYAPMNARQRFCGPSCREHHQNTMSWVDKPTRKKQKTGFRAHPLTMRPA